MTTEQRPRPSRKPRSDKGKPRPHKRPPSAGPLIPLADGEQAQPMQIRGPADAVQWFARLTALERGTFVAQHRPK